MQIQVDPAQLPSAYRAQRTARGLGWFSLALGAAELLMPRQVARACGMRVDPALVRWYGVREIASGIGILTSRDPRPWLWARTAGDVLDMGTLVTATRPQAEGARTGVALMNVAAVTAADVWCATQYRPEARLPQRDYSARSGLPDAPERLRGVARKDFRMPRDMRIPAALRPWRDGKPVRSDDGQ